MFYSTEEFTAQVSQLIAEGYSEEAAMAIVRQNEREDAAEYERWMDEQDFAHDELERDHDEPYEQEGEYYPDPDSEYESRYELHDDY